jgi:uncharacterized protein
MAKTPTLSVLAGRFAICRLDPGEGIPPWAQAGPWWSATRADQELSLVCLENHVPEGVVCEKGWRCLKVEGPLDFSEVGVLSSIALPLKEAQISICALSTYLTDHVFLKERDLGRALRALSVAGHRILSEESHEARPLKLDR